MKELKTRTSVDPDTFFSRCYDLSDAEEFESFKEHYMLIKAESIVKKFEGDFEEIEEKVLKTALTICERRALDLNELIDLKSFPENLVSDKEWDIIGKDEMSETRLAKRKHKDWLKKMDVKKPALAKIEEKKTKKKKKKKVVEEEEEESEEVEEEDLKERARAVLEKLKAQDPQYDMNGHNGIWIVKPAGLSRGRGITVFDTLVEIIDNCYREGNWVAMKYIENPMLIQKRKFDIR